VFISHVNGVAGFNLTKRQMNNKLFVGNLSWNIGDEQLKDFFSAVGTVVEAVVITDRQRGNRSKGFGFVTMSSEEEANSAVSELDGKELDGRAVNVSIARSRDEK
jgi:RNA recognition motif-containing protein